MEQELIAYFVGQGVLGVAAFLLWRRNEALEKQLYELMERRVEDHKTVNETMVGPIEKVSLIAQSILDAVRNKQGQ